MPRQTEKRNIFFGDGCQVSVKASGSDGYLDVGLIDGDYTGIFQFDSNTKEWGNGEPTETFTNMRIEGAFVLANIQHEVIDELSNGVFERVVTAGTPVLSEDFDEQVVNGFTPNVPIELSAVVTATGEAIKFSAAPVITTIVDDTMPTPVELVAGDDYFVIANQNATSRYSIMFTNTGTNTISQTAELTITFGNNTPIASETIYGGTTSFTSKPYAMRIQHFNSSGVADRSLDLYNSRTSPGSFNFGFRGANSNEYDTMEISFVADLDESLTDGRQLFAHTMLV